MNDWHSFEVWEDDMSSFLQDVETRIFANANRLYIRVSDIEYMKLKDLSDQDSISNGFISNEI